MFPVLKADQVIGEDGFPNLDGCPGSWLRFRRSDFAGLFASMVWIQPDERPVNVAE
jgi:hypothetical protein